MKVEIEYPIVVRAIPKRATTHKLVVTNDVCTVDISQYSKSEARATLKEHVRRDGKDWARLYHAVGDGLFIPAVDPVIDNGRIRYRFGHRDAAHTSPIFHADVHAEAVEAVNRECKRLKSAAKTGVYPEGLVTSYQWATSYTQGAEAPSTTELPLLSDGTIKDIPEEQVEQARQRFMARCADVVMVGDRFMLRRKEPVYVVDCESYENAPAVWLRHDVDPRANSEDEDALEPSLSRMLFAADDLDAAMDYASEIWRLQTGSEASPVMEGNRLEVLDSSCLKFDAEAAAAANVARVMEDRFVESVGIRALNHGWSARRSHARALGNLEPDSLEAFQNLSRSLAEYEAGADGDAVCAAVREALATSGASRFLRKDDMPLAELALGRWERRHVRRDLGLLF